MLAYKSIAPLNCSIQRILQALIFLFAALSFIFYPPNSLAKESWHESLGKLPRNLRVVKPDYPVDALEKGVEGEVVIEFNLSQNSTPKDIVITKAEPPGVFGGAVNEVFSHWLFLPDIKNPCKSLSRRSKQTIYFSIQEGKPIISILPVVDLIDINEEIGVPIGDKLRPLPNSHKPKPDVKYELLSAGKIVQKTKPDISYPPEENRRGTRAMVIANISILPGGNVKDINYIYTIPVSDSFTNVITPALNKTTYENHDGTKIDRSTIVCQEFVFDIP